MKVDNVGEAILRFRCEIGVGLVVVSLFMTYRAAKINISTRFIDFFPADHHNVTLSEHFHGFGGKETLVLMLQVKKGDIFNLDTLRKIHEITDEVDRLPGVNHLEIFSLSSYRVAYVQAVPGGLNVRPFMYPSVPRDQMEVEALKQRILARHQQLRHLISDDNKSTLITASVSGAMGLDYGELFKGIRKIVATNRDSGHDIFIAGEPVVRGYGYYYFPSIVAIFFIACLVIALILYANLGAYTSWWVPLLTGSCSALWGLGFVSLMGYHFDPLMLVVPFILAARDMSHAVAWQRRYYSVLNQLEDRRAACVTTANLMLLPGIVAIAADITGIFFISFSGIPVLDHIALAGTVWLAASLLMVFIFQPILMSYLPTRGHSRKLERARNLARRLEPLVDRIVEVPVTAGITRKLLLWGAAGLVVLGVVSVLNVEVGYNHPGTPLYRPDAPVNVDARAIGRKFPVDEAWVIFSTPTFPHIQSVLAPNVLRLADDLRRFLLGDPAVMQVISFASTVISPFNQMVHYGHPKYFGIPKNVQQAGNLWYLFLEGTAPGEIEHYISNIAAKETCIRVMLRDHTGKTLARVQGEIEDFFKSYAERNPAYARVDVGYMAGLAGLYAAADNVLYRVDLVNIGLVLACVFLFCTALFSSFLAGLLFVFAGALANFTALIYMYLFGIQLTIDTLPVISLAIGLGIDYGISTVSRIRAEVIAGHQLDDAIRVAFKTAGASVLSTSCVMIGGTLPWTFSPALFHHHMGVLLTVLLATNVLAGVWILPAFISWSGPGFITRHEWGPEEEGERRIAAAGRLAVG